MAGSSKPEWTIFGSLKYCFSSINWLLSRKLYVLCSSDDDQPLFNAVIKKAQPATGKRAVPSDSDSGADENTTPETSTKQVSRMLKLKKYGQLILVWTREKKSTQVWGNPPSVHCFLNLHFASVHVQLVVDNHSGSWLQENHCLFSFCLQTQKRAKIADSESEDNADSENVDPNKNLGEKISLFFLSQEVCQKISCEKHRSMLADFAIRCSLMSVCWSFRELPGDYVHTADGFGLWLRSGWSYPLETRHQAAHRKWQWLASTNQDKKLRCLILRLELSTEKQKSALL